MIFLCTVLPACIAMGIQYKRNENKCKKNSMINEILRFGRWMFFLNLFTMFVIVYVFHTEGVVQETFYSFGFATKYMIIALFFSLVIPYLIEIICSYISISFFIGEQDEDSH